MSWLICDIDGTVADVRARRAAFEAAGGKGDAAWAAFYTGLGNEPAIKPVAEVVKCLAPYHTVMWFTGRPERYRNATVAWLKQVFGTVWIPSSHLSMRAEEDFRDDVELKQEMLAKVVQSRGTMPLLAIDDRQRIVDMWRAKGIVCLQPAAWLERGEGICPTCAGVVGSDGLKVGR